MQRQLDTSAVLADLTRVADGPARDGAAAVDRDRAFPRHTIDALAAAGGLGLVVPADAGGSGGALVALAEACEALGTACASSAMVYLMHSVTAATIAAGGGEQAAEVLAGMADGSLLGTLAFSERASGAHFYAPELRAERSNGSLRVSGRKSFVTSGGEADILLLLVQGEAEGTADAYVLRGDQPGVRFEGSWDGLGMAGNSSVAMELDGVELDGSARVGAAGGATDLIFGAVAPYFLVGLSAVNVGIAAAAAAAATEHAAARRYPDGTSLAEIQAVQHAIADMDAAVRHGAPARARGRPAGGGGRPGRARRDHGVEGDGDGGRRDGDRPRARGDRGAGVHPRPPDRAPPARRARRRGHGAHQRRASHLDREGSRRPSGAVSRDEGTVLVGAVAYHPRS